MIFELRRFRDHSQIVDLAERIRVVASRASETSKISKWWQNNVQNPQKTRSKKYFLFIHHIFWAPEAPGPVSDCRSRREDSDGVIKSSGNLQNSEMVPKQCPKTFQEASQKSWKKTDIKTKWWLYLWNSPGGGKELLKLSQNTILVSLNTTYTRIPFLRPVIQMY